MKIVTYDESNPGSKIVAEKLASTLGCTYVPNDVQVIETGYYDTRPEDVRERSVKLAIDYFAAKGSNPQTDLIELSKKISEFIQKG